MGKPIFKSELVPVISNELSSDMPVVYFKHENLELKLYCVNSGVPHCVAFIELTAKDLFINAMLFYLCTTPCVLYGNGSSK